MSIRNKLNSKWVKYPVVGGTTLLTLLVVKKLATMTDDYYQTHPPIEKVMQLTADQLHDLRGGIEGLAYASEEGDKYYKQGMKAYFSKDYEAAAENFRKTKEMDGNDGSYLMLVQSLVKLEKYEETVQVGLEGISKFPNEAGVAPQLARAYQGLGDCSD